jgi:O-acetyl-ADP-ribose deacetylase (regulator of RNase III)
MITLKSGNILEAEVDAMVNPVNCVGVMGSGLAKEFKKYYLCMFYAYRSRCADRKVSIGKMDIHRVPGEYPTWVINFPTKHHFWNDSHLADIELGLQDLVKRLVELDIQSVAIPALGCGLGGLKFDDVLPLIRKAFEPLPDMQVIAYNPN